MPKAVVDNSFDKYELESLPGAFVMIRPMEYGDTLERTELSLKMTTEMQTQNRAQRRGTQAPNGPDKLNLQLGNKAVTLFEFQKCVGEHNLEDENGNLLDLTTPQGIARLHPKIGAEIGRVINEINAFDSEGN